MNENPAKRWMAHLKGTTNAPGKRAGKEARAGAVLADGFGLTSQRLRAKMVERLARDGISNRDVLAAMGDIPRHRFVDQGLASRAYEDTALPIGYEQSISQPYIVARMTEML